MRAKGKEPLLSLLSTAWQKVLSLKASEEFLSLEQAWEVQEVRMRMGLGLCS